MEDIIRARVQACVDDIVANLRGGVLAIVEGKVTNPYPKELNARRSAKPQKNGDKRKVLKLGTHGYKIDMTCRHVDTRGKRCGELSGGPRNGLRCPKHRK